MSMPYGTHGGTISSCGGRRASVGLPARWALGHCGPARSRGGASVGHGDRGGVQQRRWGGHESDWDSGAEGLRLVMDG